MNLNHLAALVNPTDDGKARLKDKLDKLTSDSTDLQSLETNLQEPFAKGIDTIERLQTATLEKQSDLERVLFDMNYLAQPLPPARKRLIDKVAEETINQQDAEAALCKLSGQLPADEQAADEKQLAAAKDQDQADKTNAVAVVSFIDLITRTTVIYNSKQDKPGHALEAPLSTQTIEQQIEAIKRACAWAMHAAKNSESEIKLRQSELDSAQKLLQDIADARKADPDSAQTKQLIDDFSYLTDPFDLYSANISVAAGDVFVFGSEARIRFEAVRAKVTPDERAELNKQIEETNNAQQSTLTDSSFSVFSLDLMQMISRLLA